MLNSYIEDNQRYQSYKQEIEKMSNKGFFNKRTNQVHLGQLNKGQETMDKELEFREDMR
jgi:hypothetical protein